MPSCARPDRDDRAASFAVGKGTGRLALAPRRPGPPFGSACRLAAVGQPFLGRDDEVPGRHVPIGFARYVSPVVDPALFAFYRTAGARVAIPRAVPGCQAAELLRLFYLHGPQAVGFVLVGDTYVPAALGPGARTALAGAVPPEMR